MNSKIRVEFTDEFGTVSSCAIEQPSFTRQDVIDWFMFTALLGIGYNSPLDGVRYDNDQPPNALWVVKDDN